MSSNDNEKKDTDESSNKSKSDVENQTTSPHSSITKNIKNQNDNISDISETDFKETENWEEMLEQFAPDKDSVTGIIRVKDDDTMGPTRRKYIKDNNLRKEVAELGIGNNIEEQFYYNHKMVFEKYSNKSDHINREQLYKILFNEFEYDNKYTDEEKVTISGVIIDNNILQYINMLNKQHISFIDYFSIAKHIDIVYKKNFNRFIKLAKESTDIAINNQILRLRDDNIRFKEDELLINEREKQIEIQNQLLSINESIDIYDIRKYQPNCCDIITNFRKQNIIDDFDKIYDIITKMPSLNNHDKNIILIRFRNILLYCSTNYNMVSKLYTSTQILLIMCSILNPALLSINSDPDNDHYVTIFWIVWISQILVSLITGYVGVFKWDKKYFLFNAYKTKINQEIWLFISLSGKHYKTGPRDQYNHKQYIHTFLDRIENFYRQLKTTEFELENTKDDNEGDTGNSGGTTNMNQRAKDILESRRDGNMNIMQSRALMNV
jgi:hypothetical protein